MFVPGNPKPQGSKSFKGINKGTGRAILAESSKGVGPWRERIRDYALSRFGTSPIPGDRPVHVRVEFVMPRPKALPKSRTPPAVKRIGDLDKLVRATFDALSKVLYADDAQITSLTASKRIAEPGENPGALIVVADIGDDQ